MSRKGLLIVEGCLGIAAALISYAVIHHPEVLPMPEIVSAQTDASVINTSVAALGSASSDPSVRMVLVNHHLLAPHLIADALVRIATTAPVTVVVVAPDHFGGGPTWATTAVARWRTPFGVMEPDCALVEALVRAGAAPRPVAMEREHGVTNLTAFIHRMLPNARLVPLLLKTSAPDEVTARLAGVLAEADGPILVVGSFDFTHESTAAEALANDRVSVRVLEAGDPAGASSVVADSVAGVRFLMEYASRTGLRFSLLERSDASLVLGQPDLADVTSYITGVWRP